MKLIRSILFWCHLAIGLAAGAVVLLMSVTGVLLTYEKQMIARADMQGLERAARAAGTPLPLDTRLALARAAAGAAPTTLTRRADAPRLLVAAIGREQVIYLDRYSGVVVGRGNARVRGFFASVTDWHRWLGAKASDAAARARGKKVTGIANLGFLFLVLSGFWLWWPRNWSASAVRSIALFRGGLAGKARDFNWHHVIGIWSLVPLFVIVVSGAVISYPWATALVYRAYGEKPPAPPGGPGGAAGAGGRGSRASTPASLARMEAMFAQAEQRAPGWRTIALTVPRADTGAVSFAIDRGNGGQPQKRATLTFDAATGAERKWEPFASQSPARRARSVLRFAHTGEVLGPVGQTLAGLVSLGAVVMVWTGIALSLRRFLAWRQRGARVKDPRIASRRAA